MGEEIIKFLNSSRSLLIAPAGYGKTTLLAECISYLLPLINKPILVLTHTHAGVASIKKKCSSIKSGRFLEITTISGFAQRIVTTYSGHLPGSQKDGKPDFPKINHLARLILRIPLVKKIIGNSYSHVFVDEYQDCSWDQHVIISRASTQLPLHILGDPLQAIFGFNDERMVDFQKDFEKYDIFKFLITPWRWYQDGNNRYLGDTLSEIRVHLWNKNEINLNALPIMYYKAESTDEDFWPRLSKFISNLQSHNLLVIFPNGFEYQIDTRAQKRTQFDFAREFSLIEAIDDKAFYSCASRIDRYVLNPNKPVNLDMLINILSSLSFNKGDIQDWFNNHGVKNKKSTAAKQKALVLKEKFTNLINDKTDRRLLDLLAFLRYDLKFLPKRPELLSSIMKVLRMQSVDSINDRMNLYRNRVRTIGRKLGSKCIGTTLLTKGLEYDDVIIIDAHKIKKREDLYVALTRASKRLIVFSSSVKWDPILQAINN